MKLSDAIKAIDAKEAFLVHFEWCGDGMLRSDYFPDPREGEEGFVSAIEAEVTGKKFAEATKGNTCNFYLIDSLSFRPIGNWKLANR